MPNDPVVRVSCSHELLAELHEAHEAMVRSRKKTKKATSFRAPALEALMVQVASARMRAAPLSLEAPDVGPER